MSEDAVFLDVNVVMYAAGKAHHYKEPCAWILGQIADGRLAAAIDTEIVQELLYRYGALREWALAVTMATSLLDLVPLVLPVTREDMQQAVTLFGRYGPQGVKARDVLHAAVMQNNGLAEIVSVDSHFDQISGLIRLDPEELFEARDRSAG